MFEEYELEKSKKAQKKLLRVSFPDGTVYCYKSAMYTFLDTIRKFGADKVAALNMEWRHNPLCSKEIIKSYEDYMKPLDNGWYINCQSDSSEKYILLKSISEKLGIECKIEVGVGFETSKITGFAKTRESKGNLLVQFADGEFIAGETQQDTFIKVISKIGLDIICIKAFEDRGKQIVTRFQKYDRQIKVKDKWVYVPITQKDKIATFERISQKMNLGLKITIVD